MVFVRGERTRTNSALELFGLLLLLVPTSFYLIMLSRVCHHVASDPLALRSFAPCSISNYLFPSLSCQKFDEMDPLPPNDPHRNLNNGQIQGKADARQDGGAELDIIGNLQDQPIVVVMFLIGVATWLLQERCSC